MIKRISSKGNNVIDTGTVFSFNAEADVDIIEQIDDVILTIRFKFQKNDQKKYQIDKKVDEANNLIELTCFNFENSLGTGTTSPIDLAMINKKNVTLHFWIFLLGSEEKAARKIDFTFFVGE